MQVLINGIEYNALNNFTITEQSGNKTVSEISVLVDTQPVPISGDVIQILDGTTSIFWGLCGIPSSPKFSTGLETHIYKIKCNNANSILSRRLANVAYQNTSVSEIISDLYSLYISAEGIELGAISDIDITLNVYTAKNYNLQSALNELADLVGATWRVDNDKKFYFLATNDFPKFPHIINSNFLIGGDFQEKTKDYKQRTVQYIDGASDLTNEQTEYFLYDGENKTFTTAFGVALKPEIYVNNALVPPEQIGVRGLDDADTTKTWFFSYNSQTITYHGNELTQNDQIQIDYIGLFNIRIAAYNTTKINEIAKLTGTSGMIENVYIGTDISTTADAFAYANSLLQQFETATSEVTFYLLSEQLYSLGLTLEDTDILTEITFDLPQINLTGNYVITERKLTPNYADMTNSAGKFRIDLKLMNRDYLKSYAETISNLKRDINQLSVRADDIVISQENINETIMYEVNEYITADTPYWCTANIVNGSLFAMMTLTSTYYPMGIITPYSGQTESGPSNYPDGDVFLFALPTITGVVYPA